MPDMTPYMENQEPEPEASRTWLYVGAGLIAAVLVAWIAWPSSPEPDVRPVAENRAPAAPKPEPETPKVEEAKPTPEPARPRAARPKPEPVVEAPPPPAPEEKPVELGTLRIESDVPGAAVFIDRKFVGNAPVTAEGIAPGSHQVNASAEGHDGIVQTVQVAVGSADLMLRFKEVKLNESLAVVHKKAFGSTDGTLVATPEGIRFDTANPKDGFTARLSDLQEFEVDYLKKNLRVKLRSGKTFNFTDKRENADALFVFHKNVDRARVKLAGSASQQ